MNLYAVQSVYTLKWLEFGATAGITGAVLVLTGEAVRDCAALLVLIVVPLAPATAGVVLVGSVGEDVVEGAVVLKEGKVVDELI